MSVSFGFDTKHFVPNAQSKEAKWVRVILIRAIRSRFKIPINVAAHIVTTAFEASSVGIHLPFPYVSAHDICTTFKRWYEGRKEDFDKIVLSLEAEDLKVSVLSNTYVKEGVDIANSL